MPIFDIYPQLFQLVYIFLVSLSLWLLLVITWYNRSFFKRQLIGIRKEIWICLILIMVAFSLVCIIWGENLNTFIHTDQEWEELKFAKNLLSGELVFNHIRHGLVYPLLLAFGFTIFGVNPLVASLLNLILAIFTIFLVFLLTQIIYKNDKISLISAFLYASTPLVFIFTTIEMGYPTLISFFLLLTVISALLYIRHQKTSLLIQVLILLVIISQIKPEYFVIVIPFMLFFIFLRLYKKIPLKKLLIIVILFIIFSLPYLDKNVAFRQSFKDLDGWCGHHTQSFQAGKKVDYNLPLTTQMDTVLKYFTSERLSVNYLIYDFPNFIKFLTFGSFLFMFLFATAGIILKFKEYKKEILYIAATFSSVVFLYLADCAFFEFRFAFPLISLFIIFTGAGIVFILNRIIKQDIRYLKNILIVIILFIISVYWYFSDYWINKYQPIITKSYYKNISDSLRIDDVYSRLKPLTKNISRENSHFIVPQNNEQDILHLLGYSASNLSDLLKIEYIEAEDKQEFFKKLELPLGKNRNNYFIESRDCQRQGELRKICTFILNNHSLKLVNEYDGDKLYLFFDSN